MAEKRPSGATAGANLLFSASSELSFSVPFIPVSRPETFSSDDTADVGEEDSFLGQTSGASNPPQTFSYFSQASNVPSGNDPFASIAQTTAMAACQSPGPGVFPKPPTSVLLPTGVHNGQSVVPPVKMMPQYPNSVQPVSGDANGNCPPVITHVCPPPAGNSQTGYNPYRHNPHSSRINPYLTPPQLQTELDPRHSSQGSQLAPLPPSYSSSSVSLPSPQAVPNFTPGPVGQPFTTSRPAITQVPAQSPFMPNLYEPVQLHWFFCKLVEGREIWMPFSGYDSANLEEIYNSVQPDPESVVVSTAGGRYDVYLYDREMKAVYWEEEDSEVRRCSWFYKGDTDSRFIPYSEEFSDKLEAEYKKAGTTNQWHRRLEFPGGEIIVMHNPKVIVQFQQSSIPDEWGTLQEGQSRPRVVKRGVDDHDEVPDGEVPQADHLVFMVHGIGPVCDLRFRSIVECVDDFRAVSIKLLQTHFKKYLEEGKVRRVEFLPVHWHSALHGDATGVDRHIKTITLPSIGRLRHFTNETLLDILFYNSPTYCQTIVDKVSLQMNRLYQLYKSRNPDFKGGVSVAGHSLGSLILFDILSNQLDTTSTPPAIAVPLDGALENPEACDPDLSVGHLPSLQEALENLSLAEYSSVFEKEKIDMESLLMCTVDDLKEMGIPLGPRKKIAKFVEELATSQEQRIKVANKKSVQLHPEESHPCDVNNGAVVPPIRKLPVGASVSSVHVDYEHFETGTGQVSVQYNPLDFEPVNFFALGSPIGMFLTVRGLNKIDDSYRLPTCKGFFNIYHPLDPVAYRLEPMIVPDLDLKPVLIPHHKGRKRLHLELKESLSRMGSDLKHGFISSLRSAWQTLNEFARAHTSSAQLQAELEKVADQIKEEEHKQQVEGDEMRCLDIMDDSSHNSRS